MIENIVVVAGQVATLFLMMGTGFVLSKKEKLTEKTIAQLSYILLHVVAPCLIVEALQIERNMEMVQGMGMMAVACVVYFTISITVSTLQFRKRAAETRAVLRFGSMYPNVGFMGFPLIRAVLGEGAMLYAALFLVIFSLIHWTHGVIVMGGRTQVSIKSALINPGTVGLVAGLFFFIMEIRIPWPIRNGLKYMGEINTPIAMLVIGAQMAGANIGRTFKEGVLYWSGSLKLIVLPGLTAMALIPLGLPPVVYSTAVILSAAPSAGMTSMFAERFKRDVSTAAQLITLTTLLSIVTLPIFAGISQWLSGG